MVTAIEKLEKEYGYQFECLALVKPRSELARELSVGKPCYCIFEYSPAFGEAQMRWGDGSFQNLETAEQLNDLIFLHDFGSNEISELFD